jgi:hypothetical protein
VAESIGNLFQRSTRSLQAHSKSVPKYMGVAELISQPAASESTPHAIANPRYSKGLFDRTTPSKE